MRISKAFLRIGIDARFAGPEGTGLGKYTEELILNLAKIDKKNDYSIFLRGENWSFFKLPKNFKKVLADIKWYSLKEQLKLSGIFLKEKFAWMPDAVPMRTQPLTCFPWGLKKYTLLI